MLGGYSLSTDHLSSQDKTLGDILGFNPSVLASGQIYVFRLEVKSALGIGWSDVHVKINQAPFGGIFDVLPRVGRSADTEFFLNAIGWVDDVDNLPLRFDMSPVSQLYEIRSSTNDDSNLRYGVPLQLCETFVQGPIFDHFEFS